MTDNAFMRYAELHARSLRDPEGFWGEAARQIDWIEPAEKIFDPSMGLYGRWFAGAVVNTCYNALDRHVAGGRANQVALIHDSPLTNTVTKFTYAQLLDEVKTLAAIMQDFGVAMGDRIIIYMPMVPEAVVAMLACARIGAVHSVVFGGFAAKELAARIDDAQPKLIFSASCGLEPGRIVHYKPLLDQAIELSREKPSACIVLQRTMLQAELVPGRDHDWEEAVAKARSAVSAIQTLNPMDVANNADLQKQIVEAQAASTAAQVRVNAAREQTPNLQAVDLFRDVMKNIEGTENRIGRARNDFIAAMNDYNTEIRLFPGNILAWIFGYHRRPLFVATTQATPELFKK